MKYLSTSIILLVFFLQSAISQVVTSNPAFPVESGPVTVYFNANEGSGGLSDYTGDVYAHAGVITENSTSGSNWKYVIAGWNENTEKAKLTRITEDYYSIEITPSIREFYGVPAGEEIQQLAFVFRSADGSMTGKDDGGSDIFIDLYTGDMKVSVISPDKNQVVDAETVIDFSAAVSETAELDLYLNDSFIKTETALSISHAFTFDTPGDYWIRVFAETAEESSADSVFVHVLGSQVNESLPEGSLDGINYLDNETARLVLYAPGKEHVFLVGEFNDWIPNNNSRMKKDNERFWLDITDLTPGFEYAFQYLVDGDLCLADPYTEKILDPWNDPWISSATYPDLKPYPEGQTSGIVSVLQTAQVPYVWNYPSFSPPDNEDLVIYELLVRDFIKAHDWKTLTDTLNYLSTLGINAIELMPINEFEGNESWGYNPSFYLALDKYYGPKEDLKVFIDSCHARGMAVIIDIAMNHSYSQSPLVQLYYDGSTGKVTANNPWYNVDSPNTVYSWGFDFNHESTSTQYFVDRVNAYWLTEFKVDGFRFDFTKGFTNTPGDGGAYDAARISILKRMADKIWSVNPETYVILEHFADNSEEIELTNHGMMIWGNTNYNYNEATMGWNESGKSNFNRISYKNRGWNNPHLVGYMESHDEERLMFKNLAYGNVSGAYNIQDLNTALARQELAGAFFFTVPGPKMIWQFGELGYDYSINHCADNSIDEECRTHNKPIRWDYFDNLSRQRLYQVYSALIHLKISEPVFTTDDFTLSVAAAGKRIELNHADMDVRIIGNFNVAQMKLDPNFSQTGTWYEYFSGKSMEVTDVNELITVDPGKYKIYTTKQLAKPDIIAQIEQVNTDGTGTAIYPVPAKEILYISSNMETRNVTIFDLNGRMMKQLNMSGRTQEVNISDLTGGVYILRLEYENELFEFKKFVKN